MPSPLFIIPLSFHSILSFLYFLPLSSLIFNIYLISSPLLLSFLFSIATSSFSNLSLLPSFLSFSCLPSISSSLHLFVFNLHLHFLFLEPWKISLELVNFWGFLPSTRVSTKAEVSWGSWEESDNTDDGKGKSLNELQTAWKERMSMRVARRLAMALRRSAGRVD